MKRKTFLTQFCLLCLSVGCAGGASSTVQEERQQVEDGWDEEDDIESWESLPFPGELHFELVDEATGEPLPSGMVDVQHLYIREISGIDPVPVDENGRIILTQPHEGHSYFGDGPPPPRFIFSANGYETAELSVDDLGALIGIDPYGNHDEYIFEFTIGLTCVAENCMTTSSEFNLKPVLSMVEVS